MDQTDPVGGFDGTPGSVYTWSVAPNLPGTVTLFAGTITTNQSPGGFNNRVIIDWANTLPGSYLVTVQETTNGCQAPPVTLEVIISYLNATVASTSPVCNGDDAIFTFTGPANGTLFVTVNGSPQTIILDAGGNGTYTVTGATTNQTMNLDSVHLGTCSNPLTGSSTVVVNPLLNVSVSGATPICSGDNAIFTFNGGPANGTVNFTVNGAPQSVTLNGTGTGSYTVAGATVDQTLNIVTVSDGTCMNSVSGSSVITISPLLTVSVGSLTPICYGADAEFTFTGGPANGTVNITVNGTPQTITLDAAGNGSYTVSGASSNQVVNLVSVSAGTCSNPVTGSSTVVVNPLLTVSVNALTPVCYGVDAEFSFTGGPANATVSITVNGTPQSVTLNGAGNGNFTVPAATANQVVNMVSVDDGTCNNAVTGSATVVVNPLLTVSLTALTPICSGDDAVFTFNGGPANGTVSITVNGSPQSVTLNSTGGGTYTVSGATVDQTVNVLTVSDGTCSNSVTASATIVVNSVLSATVTPVTPICAGSDAVFNFTGPANGSVSITVNGTPQTVTLDAAGNGTYTVTGASANQTVNLVSVTNGSCSNTVTGTGTVVVNPIPTTSPIFHD